MVWIAELYPGLRERRIASSWWQT